MYHKVWYMWYMWYMWYIVWYIGVGDRGRECFRPYWGVKGVPGFLDLRRKLFRTTDFGIQSSGFFRSPGFKLSLGIGIYAKRLPVSGFLSTNSPGSGLSKRDDYPSPSHPPQMLVQFYRLTLHRMTSGKQVP